MHDSGRWDHRDVLLGHVLRLPESAGRAGRARGRRRAQHQSRRLFQRSLLATVRLDAGHLPGYDSRGNRVLSIDPKGNSSITVFDGASRTIQTQQHLRQAGQGQNPPAPGQTFLPGSDGAIVTTFLLDGNGRQTQLIDDRGDITLFEYDTLDREVKMIFHDGSTRTSVYDEAGDVTSFTDENGSVFQNTFDALGRKTAVTITLAAGVVRDDSPVVPVRRPVADDIRPQTAARPAPTLT